MQRSAWLYITFCVLVSACVLGTKPSKRVAKEEDDFSLNELDGPDKVDDKSYFNDLQRSEAAVGFESSFPLAFVVGKSVDRFEGIPEQAKLTGASLLTIQLGECRFTLKTGPVQVDRYILAGQWIKLNEGLPAGVPVKLEPHMDLNLKFISRLAIEIPSSQVNSCKSIMEGRKIYLGRFHLNKSKTGFLAAPGFPRAVFSSRSMEPKGKRVFVRWQSGAASPILIDDLDFPATSESGIYRALMGEKGYYYLVFLPSLRMEHLDQVVIKIPFPS